MIRTLSLFAFCLASAFAPLAGALADQHSPMPAAAVGHTITAIATVKAINHKTREVTLENAEGEEHTFVAGEEVRNLDQVKKGQQVLMEYYEGLAVELGPKGTGLRERRERVEASRAEPGAKPAGKLTETVEVLATVTAVDRKAREVTVRGTERTLLLKVADDVDLDKVQVGSEVRASYVTSFAVSVLPAADVSGTVDIETKAVALGVGFEWGGGTLTLRDGTTKKFKLRGLSVIDIGVSKVSASGEVFKLADLKDFAGNYVSATAGAVFFKGGAAVIMKNEQGVVMRIRSKQKGVRLTLAPQGLRIEPVE